MSTRSLITTHVLDTSTGRPAANILVRFDRKANQEWQTIAEGRTNQDGRLLDLLSSDSLAPGDYRLVFDTAEYFAAAGTFAFFPQIAVEFRTILETQQHHVPLLVSPFGYTTYRGS